MQPAFAIWLTGLPASGKSTIAAALVRLLAARGVEVGTLESDVLRPILTPSLSYSEAERDGFYGKLADIARRIVEQGTSVIIDATANRRRYRDQARRQITRFVEVFVDAPLVVCVGRDPKGIYRRGMRDPGATVPGLQVAYEPPVHPELVVWGDRESSEEAARRVVARLDELGYLEGEPDPAVVSQTEPPGA